MKYIVSVCSALLISIVSTNASANKAIAKYCGGDAQRYCAEVATGQGRKYRCLLQHRYQLSPACKVTLEVATSFFYQHAANVCRIDIKHLCNRVRGGRGRIVSCLNRNFNQLDKGCAAVVVKVTGRPARIENDYSGD